MTETDFINDTKEGPIALRIRAECAAHDHPPHANLNRVAGCYCGYVKLKRPIPLQIPESWSDLPTAKFWPNSGQSAVADKVKEVVLDIRGPDGHYDEVSDLRRRHKFIDDLGVDELIRLQLIMAFEEAFQKEVPDEVAEQWRTIGDVVNHFQQETEDT